MGALTSCLGKTKDSKDPFKVVEEKRYPEWWTDEHVFDFLVSHLSPQLQSHCRQLLSGPGPLVKGWTDDLLEKCGLTNVDDRKQVLTFRDRLVNAYAVAKPPSLRSRGLFAQSECSFSTASLASSCEVGSLHKITEEARADSILRVSRPLTHFERVAEDETEGCSLQDRSHTGTSTFPDSRDNGGANIVGSGLATTSCPPSTNQEEDQPLQRQTLPEFCNSASCTSQNGVGCELITVVSAPLDKAQDKPQIQDTCAASDACVL